MKNGIQQGVTPPATHALMAQWAPPLERSKMGSFVYAGMLSPLS